MYVFIERYIDDLSFVMSTWLINIILDVIQTVGPMNQDPVLLSGCYTNSLKLANEKGLKSIVSLTS